MLELCQLKFTAIQHNTYSVPLGPGTMSMRPLTLYRLCPKWYSIHLKVMHYIGNRVPFGTHTQISGISTTDKSELFICSLSEVEVPCRVPSFIELMQMQIVCLMFYIDLDLL